MNSKRSAKRSQQSQGYRESSNRGASNSETRDASQAAVKPGWLAELGAKVLGEAEERIKDVYGPDGLRKVLRLDGNPDPVVLATMAAQLAPKEYDRVLDRQAIVRA